ncbi:MAG: pyrroloquinoline quinone biosynthesis protein PqqB [Phycisphaerae bacterium]|nr:pyrroloquinoline quinone biosynthesis protein PqqB [Saprospiraceae bacterium]
MHSIKLVGILLLVLCACMTGKPRFAAPNSENGCFLIVLGITQDGGYPHAGCQRECCRLVFSGKQKPKPPVCLGLIDRRAGKVFMIEATPAFAEQWRRLQEVAACPDKRAPDGIFVTHAHIGHYTGLMQLGREVMGTKNVPVWAMPRMEKFLRENGPWSQLVSLQNIDLQPLRADSTVQLTADLRITPFLVPHRDEFSETVGYRIETPRKKVVFIPDIDKWEKWQRDIVTEVRSADCALLDATFFKDGELKGRAMKEVPHPFVEETMRRFALEPAIEKKKVTFIHLNHTNPLLWDKSAQKELLRAGFSLAEEGMVIGL